MKRYTIILLAGSILGSLGAAQAASPPEYINYQGVLRDGNGRALDGDYDMEFHFYDSDLGGNRLLTDGHTSFDPVGPVIVIGGLFNVHLGEGTIAPGTHATLGEMFAAQNPVWLEVEIRKPPAPGEVLSPRVRVISAAYALNARRLDGRDAGSFLDTSSTPQTKSGKLVLDASSQPGSYGVEARGPAAGGYFADTDGTSEAQLAWGDTGITAQGSGMGGSFFDTDATSEVYLARGDTGVEARGSYKGGYFADVSATSEVELASGRVGVWSRGSEKGIEALGSYMGGAFVDIDSTGGAYLAWDNTGVWASGSAVGGYFADSDGTGRANVGVGDRGIEAYGSQRGGEFHNTDGNSAVYLAESNVGVLAWAGAKGGSFWNLDGTGRAEIAVGDRGIEAIGTEMGGLFRDGLFNSEVRLAAGTTGVRGSGLDVGGYFEDANQTGYANVGIGERGIEAYGSDMGGYFKDSYQSGYAHVGYGDKGIEGFGSYMGGYFKDTDDLSDAKVAFGGYGIRAYGTVVGGRFDNLTTGSFSELGHPTYKLYSNGAGVSFVQNHPEQADQVIVYVAPEGNEIATYTRGTARLIDGKARIRLDETFKWVTSPDIGLTAYVTPQGECNGLYVDSLSTEELIVRELGEGGGDVAFDYLVWGLRIGFEELPVIQEKTGDAYLPRIDEALEVYHRLPELRRHNALERFKAMRVANGETDEVDLSATLALREAIGVYDPAIHGDGRPEIVLPPGAEPSAVVDRAEDGDRSHVAPDWRGKRPGATEILAEEEAEDAASPLAQYLASEPIEVGDLVALDKKRPHYLRRASRAADAAIFGIAAGEAQLVDEELRVELVESRYARVKADASYGAILPGDLLVSSPTPGHVMRAVAPLPGTIVGKAAERLGGGVGLIQVLVMLR